MAQSGRRPGDPWDPAKPAGLAQRAPLTPEYQAIFETSLADQAAGGRGNNYQTSCVLDGMPRIMSLTAPMEILIQPAYTILIFENAFPRRIYTDGRKWPTDEEPTFEGYSIGKWIDEDGDGRYDVLEVETRLLTGPRALEVSAVCRCTGTMRPSSRSASISTRPTRTCCTTRSPRSTTPSRIPGRSTRPMCASASRNGRNICAARRPTASTSAATTYAVSPDGKLMPVREGQPPPDLRYFKPPPK